MNDTPNLSDLPEIAELQMAVKTELDHFPELREHLIAVKQQMSFIKDTINRIIIEIKNESPSLHDRSINCHDISFRMDESGLYSFYCVTYGLALPEDYQEDLTEIGMEVKSRLLDMGITRTVFLHSDFPF